MKIKQSRNLVGRVAIDVSHVSAVCECSIYLTYSILMMYFLIGVLICV